MCSAEWPLANAPVAAARRKLQNDFQFCSQRGILLRIKSKLRRQVYSFRKKFRTQNNFTVAVVVLHIHQIFRKFLIQFIQNLPGNSAVHICIVAKNPIKICHHRETLRYILSENRRLISIFEISSSFSDSSIFSSVFITEIVCFAEASSGTIRYRSSDQSNCNQHSL